MRLRGAGADSDTEGDNLITDAVQQLLQEKSALQQKVSNLSRQNEALQVRHLTHEGAYVRVQGGEGACVVVGADSGRAHSTTASP